MPSTYSSSLRLELQATGENANTWGVKTNNNLNLLQQAIAGYTQITLVSASATYALNIADASASDGRNAFIKFVGTVASAISITVPDVAKGYWVKNSATGSPLTFRTSSGTGFTLPSNEWVFAIADGASVVNSTPTSLAGYAKLASTQIFTGANTFTSAVNIQSNLSVTGNALVSGAATLSSSVDIKGATSLASTLVANGNATFNGNVSVSGSFLVSGVATLASAVDIKGPASLASTLVVGGAATLNGNVSVSGTLVGGAATLTGNVSVGGTFTVSGASTFNNTVSLVGTSAALALTLPNAGEVVNVSSAGATGTINFDITRNSIVYYTSVATGNWTLNFRGNSGTTLNSLMGTGQAITAVFMATQGGTAYYSSAVQVDSTAVNVTTRWLGGASPTNGNVSAVDVYSYTIIKTGAATYTIFANRTSFA